MFQTILSQTMLLLCLAVLVFAWLKGENPERAGSSLMVGVTIAITIFQALTASRFGPLPILIADGIVATGFLLLAVRYASLWLAAAMVLQGAVFLLHASVLMEIVPESHFYYYYAIMNLATFLVIVSIAAGTAAAWRRRRRVARETAASAIF